MVQNSIWREYAQVRLTGLTDTDIVGKQVTLLGDVTMIANACCVMKRWAWTVCILPEMANVLSFKRR